MGLFVKTSGFDGSSAAAHAGAGPAIFFNNGLLSVSSCRRLTLGAAAHRFIRVQYAKYDSHRPSVSRFQTAFTIAGAPTLLAASGQLIPAPPGDIVTEILPRMALNGLPLRPMRSR